MLKVICILISFLVVLKLTVYPLYLLIIANRKSVFDIIAKDKLNKKE